MTEQQAYKWLLENRDKLTLSEQELLAKYNTDLILAEYRLHQLYKWVQERLSEVQNDTR